MTQQIAIHCKSHVENCIDKKKALYQANHEEMVANFRRERSITDDYNGRQIMELIQNADDQESTKILIELDKTNRILRVSNKGIPFSTEGYSSLFVDNLSPKTNRKKYIGNKGLGFRSILNWAMQIKVISNGFALIYSDDTANEQFKKLFDNETRLSIQESYANGKDVGLVPILAFPMIEDAQAEEGYTTTIEIQYKDSVLVELEEQINQLDENVLMFLNNVEEINFKGTHNDKSCRAIKEDVEPYSETNLYADEKIIIDQQTWYVYKKEGELPKELVSDSLFEEAEFFEIKLAYNPISGNRNYLLYNYFPTTVLLDLPILLHVTFDLTANRNNIRESNKNKYIAKEAANFIKEIALKMKKLTPNDSKWDAYDMLKAGSKSNDLKVIEFYQPLEEALKNELIYPCIDNSYGLLSKVYKLDDDLTSLIENTSNGRELFSDVLKFSKKHIAVTDKIPGFRERIEKLELASMKQRAQLIYLLYQKDKKDAYHLLLNKEGQIIRDVDEVYTPTYKPITIPSFCKLEFINNELYEALINTFEIKSEKKARDLSKYLEEPYKLIDYEPAPLANRIIRDSRSSENEDLNKEAIKSLYNIYNANPTTDIRTSMRVRTKANTFNEAGNLIFPGLYPSGEKVEEIFNAVYTDNDYLCVPAYYGLGEEDISKLDRFFNWLGVNKYAHFTTNNIARIQEIINNIEKEQLVYWICIDRNLDNYIKSNKGNILSVINRRFHFDHHFLEDKYSWFNENPINYDHPIFKQNQLGKKAIDGILVNLGAKEEIEDLNLTQIQYILDQIPSELADGRNSQTIYKRLMREKMAIRKDTYLFADNGSVLKPYPSSKIYFSEKIILPRQLKTIFPIFNFPARSGGKTAINFYQINNLDKIKIDIQHHKPSTAKDEFTEFIEKLRPFILASRLSNIKDEDTRKKATKQIKDLRLIFCEELIIRTQGKMFQLNDNEYIRNNKDGLFYFKLNNNATLSGTNKMIEFSRALSEVFAQVLDVSADQARFELEITYALVDIDFLRQRYQSEMSNDSIEEAKELLEILTPDIRFIHVICELLDKDYENKNDSIRASFEVNKIDFENWTKIDNQKFVYNKLIENAIDIDKFNSISDYMIDFSNKHKEELNTLMSDNSERIRYSLWKSLEGTSPTEQQNFLSLSGKWKRYNVETIAKENKSILKLNIPSIFEKICNELYPDISLEKELYWSTVDDLYTANKANFEEDELNQIREYFEQESLLYFENTIGELRSWLEAEKMSRKKAASTKSASEVKPKQITLGEAAFKASKPNSKPGVFHTPYRFTSRGHRNNLSKGQDAEKKVFDYLRQNYEEVEHTSNFDDGLHYDMSYRCPLRDKWIYVEVKSFEQNQFFLSREEYNFGKANKEQYEIWLVREDVTYRITDLFDDNDNEKYNLEIDGYIIYTELN